MGAHTHTHSHTTQTVWFYLQVPLQNRNETGVPLPSCDITKDLLYLETESEDQIAAVHIRRGLRGTDRVILYSHGNAEDLGQRLYLG